MQNNSFRTFDAADREAAAITARADLYFFSRWMFLQRKGFKWKRSAHHRLICDKLMQVYRGEITRLIINVPPRYSKTELAVVNFIAWCFGKSPDCEFIHTSYSGALAINNSSSVLGAMSHEAYAGVFPEVGIASAAAHHWKTTAGGVMYATGTGGTITGFGAGKHREGFGGCFPVGTRVWTESGLVQIDRIVRERMAVNVWAYDYAGRMVLRPVVGWHENPPNSIVRVSFDDGATVECTPDHRFWTDGRGWVRADSLSKKDRLPCVRGGVEGSDYVGIDTKVGGGRLDAAPVFASDSATSVLKGDGGLRAGQNRSRVGGGAAPAGNVFAAGNGGPGVAAPDLVDDRRRDPVLVGNLGGSGAGGAVDRQGLRAGEQCARVGFGFTECAVRLAVGDVCGPAVVPKIAGPVVPGIAVCVADIGPFWAGSGESQQHQRVNAGILDAGPLRQTDAQVAAGLLGWHQDLAGLDVGAAGACIRDTARLASDPACVADRVSPFVSGHRKPVLIEYVRHDESTFCLTVEEHHNFTVERGLVVKNCIVIDDPHKADEATSDVIRQGVIDWFQNTLESRKNDPENTPIIVIMQRLHEKDLSGWLLGGGNGEHWDHLCLEAVCEREDDPVGRKIGEPLWPAKHSAEMLETMRRANGYVFSGQYQQRPSPLGGGLIKGAWFKRYTHPPRLTERKIYADTAQKTKEHNDYSVFQCWGRGEDGAIYLLDQIRGKWEAPELKRRAADFWAKHAAVVDTGAMGSLRAMMVEDKSSGTGLIQDLRVSSSIPIIPVQRNKDKLTRVMDVVGYIEAGRVAIPEGADYSSDFVNECEAFTPNDTHTHDDQIDPMCDAITDLIAAGNSLDIWARLAG